ncbi:hypothetical protein IAU60_000756 [Kwoniella sp. DSM 27419]
MSSTDRQPLLPTHSTHKPHVNHSSSSRLSTTRISFPSSSTSALAKDDEHDPFPLPRSNSDREGGDGRMYEGSPLTATAREERKPGLPKLSRECLWSEIKCYGSYMLPPLLVFGVLVIGASLFAVGWKMGWFK